MGITYVADSEGLKLQGYTDSDWAGDHQDQKSTSGYVYKLLGAPVSWNLKKQPIVTCSSTEAEYMAASIAVKEAIWLR